MAMADKTSNRKKKKRLHADYHTPATATTKPSVGERLAELARLEESVELEIAEGGDNVPQDMQEVMKRFKDMEKELELRYVPPPTEEEIKMKEEEEKLKKEREANAEEERLNIGNNDDLTGDLFDPEREEEQKVKKKRKKLQFTLADLKQEIDHPELVEPCDCTGMDPLLLIYLKRQRGAVGVPVNWANKRKYLHGLGLVKIPYQLPDYIEATGVSQLRQAYQEQQAEKGLRQTQRERAAPKLGRMEIDYQVLHDAFFKYQKKDKYKLTRHGDIYYEGKAPTVAQKPRFMAGVMSPRLRQALGMPLNDANAPVPWLSNILTFGMPPAYPNLKLAGLNPDGTIMDPSQNNNNSSSSSNGGALGAAALLPAPVVLWGENIVELQVDEDGEMVEGDENNNKNTGAEGAAALIEGDLDGAATATATATAVAGDAFAVDSFLNKMEFAGTLPGGVQTPSGFVTPAAVELRKKQYADDYEVREEYKPLYYVLDKKAADKDKTAGHLFNLDHQYVMPPANNSSNNNNNGVDVGEKRKATGSAAVDDDDEVHTDIKKKKTATTTPAAAAAAAAAAKSGTSSNFKF